MMKLSLQNDYLVQFDWVKVDAGSWQWVRDTALSIEMVGADVGVDLNRIQRGKKATAARINDDEAVGSGVVAV